MSVASSVENSTVRTFIASNIEHKEEPLKHPLNRPERGRLARRTSLEMKENDNQAQKKTTTISLNLKKRPLLSYGPKGIKEIFCERIKFINPKTPGHLWWMVPMFDKWPRKLYKAIQEDNTIPEVGEEDLPEYHGPSSPREIDDSLELYTQSPSSSDSETETSFNGRWDTFDGIGPSASEFYVNLAANFSRHPSEPRFEVFDVDYEEI